MIAAAVPSTPLSNSHNLRDFPDRLTPMLVKELRQGMRSKIFVWGFLLMHLLLAFVVLSSINSSMSHDSSTLFWWCYLVPAVFALPFRGFNALVDEIRMDTMDTLLLTRLSASRIVLGKWISITLQIALISLTVLPYLIMRYFAGGVDIALEIRFLFHFFMLGAIFTAFVIGFSWIKVFLMRGLLILALGGLVFALCVYVTEEILVDQRYDYKFFITEHEGVTTAIFYLLGSYLTYYLLSFASAQIAPLAENLSTRRRIISFAFVLLCFVPVFFDVEWMFPSFGLALLVVALAGIDAATERTQHLSIVVQPFVKRGLFGKFLGRFLYPGWHTGFNYLVLLLALCMAVGLYAVTTSMHLSGPMYKNDFILVMLFGSVMITGQVFLGLFIQRRLFPRTAAPFVVFILIQVVIGFFIGLLTALIEISDASPALAILGGFSPVAGMVHMEANRFHTELLMERWLIWNVALVVIYYIGMRMMARNEFKQTREMEAEAQREFSPKSNTP